MHLFPHLVFQLFVFSFSTYTYIHTVLLAICPRETALSGYSINFPSPFIPKLGMLLGQAQTLNILLDTIPLSLPWTTPLSCSINLRRHKPFDPTGIILMFSMPQPSQSTFLDSQTDWFRSQEFSYLCISFLSFH